MYADALVRREDCGTLSPEERPPTCGTPRCQCARVTVGGFERWDAALETRELLNRRWLSLRDVDASNFGDVLELDIAVKGARDRLRTDLVVIANAKGVENVDEWVTKQMASYG